MMRPAALHRWGSRSPAVIAAVIAFLGAGIIGVSAAAWIHVKATLAQILIEAAWQRELAGSADARPWPWADTRPSARLTIRAGGEAHELMVLEGSSGRNLAFGPAHDPASVMPGEAGNSVIEGHRDTHFAVLRGVRLGDTVSVDTVRRRHATFVVTSIEVIDSRRVRIALDASEPRLTLVTCYPFDAVVPGGPLRLVVTADPLEHPRDDLRSQPQAAVHLVRKSVTSLIVAGRLSSMIQCSEWGTMPTGTFVATKRKSSAIAVSPKPCSMTTAGPQPPTRMFSRVPLVFTIRV
jgi:sortase A